MQKVLIRVTVALLAADIAVAAASAVLSAKAQESNDSMHKKQVV